MADRAGLHVIGFAFSTITAVVMLVAAMTVTTKHGHALMHAFAAIPARPPAPGRSPEI